MSKLPITLDLIPKTKWKWIVQFILIVQGLVILVVVSSFAYFTYLFFESGIIYGLIASVFMLFILYLFKRFIELTFFVERITATSTHLTIIIKSAVSKKSTTIALTDIDYFGQARAEFYTDSISPFIETRNIDRTGLSVERRRKYLVEGGGMEIRTRENILIFGRNMVSYDTDELVRKVEYHTGMYFNK